MAEKTSAKSRSGCHTCKLKRRKCDERKPCCVQCTNRGIKCGGYSTKYKWRPCHDSNRPGGAVPHDGVAQKRPCGRLWLRREWGDLEAPAPPTVKQEPGGPPPLLLDEHLELASLSVVGKSSSDLKFDNELLAQGINPATFERAAGRRRSAPSGRGAALPRKPAMPRSYSQGDQGAAMVQFRIAMRRPDALESLAEAAVEMRRPSPPRVGVGALRERKCLNDVVSGRQVARPNLTAESNGSIESNELNEFSEPNESDNTNEFNVFKAGPNARTTAGSKTRTTAGPNARLTVELTAKSYADCHADPNVPHGREEARASFPATGFPDTAPSTPAHDWAEVHLNPSLSALLSTVLDDKPETPLSPLELTTPADLEPGARVPLRLLADVCVQLLSGLQALLVHTSEQQQILFLYASYTCGIMSIKAGAENPWRTAVVAQASRYLLLYNSIASMTLFHLAGNTRLGHNAALRSKGYLYMKKCILELASRLSQADLPRHPHGLPADIALATCLNLAVSESWDTHTSSGIAHLKGAKSMIQLVLQLVRPPGDAPPGWLAAAKKRLVLVSDDEWAQLEAACPNDNWRVPRNLQLLFNTWVYFEVLSQMTSHQGTDDKGIDLVATITKATVLEDAGSPHSDHLHRSDLAPARGSGANFFDKLDLMLNDDYIDPLLGCAQSLFLVMGRVASLIARVRQTGKKAARNSLAHITYAAELRKQLVDWRSVVSFLPPAPRERAGLPSWDLYSCLATAEAYRHATLLYLYQAVPEVALAALHQLAERIFVLLAAIPLTSNLHITHIFPLLVASCEALPGEEREWCEARWAMLSERLWIGNIDRALEVVKEVWRRTDEMLLKAQREANDSALVSDGAGHELMVPGACTAVGISSRCHWGAVMREWDWEVLLA